jgi:hypothetical protein
MDKIITMNAEQKRLDENATKEVPLELWGPYLSERQWGTVREDYSETGDAWNYFPHDHARSRVYKWGEDGIAGISDYNQQLCFALSFWNGKDPILKERMFGLTNGEGNHGEDVKELYYYLDNIPTHYYMKYLYKYPHAAFPYLELIEQNKRLGKQDTEFEILDTGVFNDDKYFDITIEYAKKNSSDIFVKISILNLGTEMAPITALPTVWFFNNWHNVSTNQKPVLQKTSSQTIKAIHEKLGDYYFYALGSDEILMTENETNHQRLFNQPNNTEFVKDAFHNAIICGEKRKELAAKETGTKCASIHQFNIPSKVTQIMYVRLTDLQTNEPFENGFENIFQIRKQEADDFYADIIPTNIEQGLINVHRQAYAGLLWSKQYYHYDIDSWVNTSDGITPLTNSRKSGRNSNWDKFKSKDVLLMPDKWEYPWFAAWDLAFHCIPMASIDPVFAKNQLITLMREWFMNPEGQVPAYEWNFSDVNPPVQAFAALRIYEIEKLKTGKGDISFLKKIFQKLIINFTWWVNRKDSNGNNIFEGGFLGLDNIGVFNRSIQLPGEIVLEQTDGTAWMGMYALNMMDIALEIASQDDSFEDMGIKFYEHFIYISEALNELGLWNDEHKFFYDVLSLVGEQPFPLKVRSIVGLIPLFAVSVFKKELLEKLGGFRKRMEWFNHYRSDHHKFLANANVDQNPQMIFSLVNKERLQNLLEWILKEEDFLSVGGVRALSKHYHQNPYQLNINGEDYGIQYDPGDSSTGLFGGNSNWRGPIWMPLNYLLIKSIHKYGDYYGNDFKIEHPSNSGNFLNLHEVADLIKDKILQGFMPDANAQKAIFGKYNWFYQRPNNQDLLLYFEYFDGDTQRGLGASHQTGWTALIADLII